MTQSGEGHEAQGAAPQVLTVGSPSVGDILADRYQIEGHVRDDALGRQLYRGMDVILRRPVTVVLRQPGGDAASEMLAAAVASSRVVHPHLVGVYDAIDEGDRAYVVREWIDGVPLPEAVADGQVEAGHAMAIAWAVADAVAALHATGVAHGNVHPGTVMIAQDGRVMLADARADDDATQEADIRAIGGVLYYALTGFWPHDEAGPAPAPDGVHADGRLLPPRELREDVPEAVDELTRRLLDTTAEAPSAEQLAAELAELTETNEDVSGEHAIDINAFRTASEAPATTRPSRRKLLFGVGLVTALVVAVTLIVSAFTGGSDDSKATPGKSNPSAAATKRPSGQRHTLQLSGGQVRVVAPKGDRDNESTVNTVVDGSPTKGWRTQHYASPDFGGGSGAKPGIGIWVDLGGPQRLVSVQVETSVAGATMELRRGDTDPGSGRGSADTDAQIVANYQHIGDPITTNGTTAQWFVDSDDQVRYLLIWITKLPVDPAGKNASIPYGMEVEEIHVEVQ